MNFSAKRFPLASKIFCTEIFIQLLSTFFSMTELVINVPEELKKQAEESNIDLSKLLVTLIKREVLKQILLKRFKSKEEQDLINWSV